MSASRLLPATDTEVLGYWRAWSELFRQVRDFEPDVLVLVARKMPRVFDLVAPDFPSETSIISDQAVPFCRSQLQGARVAIVDDIWNVGSTMVTARDRVEAAGPNRIQLFALAARQLEDALRAGVRLAVPGRMPDTVRGDFASYAANALRFVSKPFDADFPIIEQSLRDPFSTWDECWSWLRARFGDRAFSLTDPTIEAGSFARATVSLGSAGSTFVKARLYFDFLAGTCNVVPMLLRGQLDLENTYPPASLPHRVFEELARASRWSPQAAARDALARAQVFCDALTTLPLVREAFDDMLLPSAHPFSFGEAELQFGSEVAAALRVACASTYIPAELPVSRQDTTIENDKALLSNERLTSRAKIHLRDQLPLHALAALLDDLSKLVGADDPDDYSLDGNRERIERDPYQRLRIGFSFRGLTEFFGQVARDIRHGYLTHSALVGELLDILIDRGAVVPTFTTAGDCLRIYRKGECDPKVDEMVNRVEYALRALPRDDNAISRTRTAKLLAIMAYSGTNNLSVQAMERGVVATVPHSVVERQDAELTRALAVRGRGGLWA